MERFRELVRFDGRLGRLAYWRAWLLLFAVGTLNLIVAYAAIIHLSPLFGVLLLPLAPIVWANVAIAVRRLHDRGKSGWWIVLFVVVPFIISAGAEDLVDLITPGGAGLAILAALGLEVWGFIEICCRRGTAGFNRFGPNPTEPDPEAVFA